MCAVVIEYYIYGMLYTDKEIYKGYDYMQFMLYNSDINIVLVIYIHWNKSWYIHDTDVNDSRLFVHQIPPPQGVRYL